MSLVKINASGTTADAFAIGKRGPTIHQGSSTPVDTSGTTGDLYIRTGTAPRLFQKMPTGWTVPTTSAGFSREEVYAGDTLNVAETTTYVALRGGISVDNTAIHTDSTTYTVDAGAAGNATIVLPAGYEGQIITIKDEAGVADEHPFTVTPSSGQIDNVDEKVFSTALVTVQVLHTGGGWWIISKT